MTQATQNFDLTLTLDQTNLILGALSKLPYENVVAVIGQIQSQAQSQLPQATADAAPVDSAPVDPTQQ